jgi:hypothetical protein
MALSKNSIPVRLIGQAAYEELTASESGIYPGMLCERVTATTCRKNANAEAKCAVLVAIEDSLQGAIVSTAYTNARPVRLIQFRSGEEFHAYLAAYQTVSIGEGLVSNGAGAFKSAGDSAVSQGETIVEAMEAATYGSSTQLIRVRVR